MEPFIVLIWIYICVYLPLTILVISLVCCVVRRDQVPVIYYANLLIANLIVICVLISFVFHLDTPEIFIVRVIFGVMANLSFKMCIALERYFFIACPLLDFIRQTKGSVLVCVLVWSLCIVMVPLAILLRMPVPIFIIALFPAPLLIFCVAGTLRALPAATSVSTEDKRRIIGTLSLLLFNYFLMIVPAVIVGTFLYYRLLDATLITVISFILLLLSPFVDLILLFFMQKGPIDKLLVRLCSMDNTAADVAADPQCD